MVDCGLKEEEGVGLISLDVEKAFDSIDHTYMFQVLQKLGFGEMFIGFVKLLYNNISSLCLDATTYLNKCLFAHSGS